MDLLAADCFVLIEKRAMLSISAVLVMKVDSGILMLPWLVLPDLSMIEEKSHLPDKRRIKR